MKKLRFILLLALLCCFLPPFAMAKANYSVQVQGVTGDILKNIESRLAVEKNSVNEVLTREKLQNFQMRLPGIIQRAMEPYGYFSAQVQTYSQYTDKKWLITAKVSKGKPVTITHFHIAIHGPGKNNKAIQKVVKHAQLKKGDVFRADYYDSLKQNLFSAAREEGYIQAELEENKILINREQGKVQIEINFHTGAQYYFGDITIDSGPYKKSFVRRFIHFKKNTPFSSSRLLALQQAMMGSYYFDQVNITPQLKHTKKHDVPLYIQVTAPKAKKYSLGIGYGTLTGMRFTAGMALRRIGKNGHHLSSQLKLSQVQSGLAVKYYIPGKEPLTEQWVLGASYQRFNPKNGISKSATVSGGYSRKLGLWQLNYNLNYLIDRYTIFNSPRSNNSFSKLLYPNINISYTKADDVVNPTVGKYFMANFQAASQDIFSSTDFLQIESKAKLLFSPISFGKVILRADFGYTITDNIKELPFSMGFFAGGLNSVRGYPDSSFGPARYLMIGSIEYQNHLRGNWDGAIFYDKGNAINHWGDPLVRGVGVGVIYRSLIGPIKLYVARGLDSDSTRPRIEFSIGPEF